MQDYSKEHCGSHGTPPPSPPINTTMLTSTSETLESEFDRHQRKLVEDAMHEQHSGWAAELQRYLQDVPGDISKDSDIIPWWSVHHSFQL